MVAFITGGLAWEISPLFGSFFHETKKKKRCKLTSTTVSIQSVDGEDDGEHVADVVEAGQELAELQTEAGVLEQVYRVHGDDADADQFLHDLQPDGQEDAPPQLFRVFVLGQQHGGVMVCSGRFQFVLDHLLDGLEFVLDVGVAGRLQHIAGFLLPAHLHQPPRRFGEEVDAEADDEDEDDLQRQGGPPRHFLVGVQVGEILDPVGQRQTADVHEEFNGQERATGGMAADFGGPDGDDAVDGSHADAGDDARTAHPGDVHRRGLKHGAEEGPE